MKLLKGFNSFKYVLENKDVTLYNKNDEELFYDKDLNELRMRTKNNKIIEIILNDKILESEWYTEKKEKVAFLVYINNKLKNIEEHFIFNINGGIGKTADEIAKNYKKDGNENIKVKTIIFE